MPGVPSGRACDACRIARKKCDSGVPFCSRCIRLNIICVGSGQRRFQFKGPKCRRKPSPFQAKDLPKLQQSPSSPAQLLLASFLKSIRPETEHRFSLLHTYGPFLKYVPQRLGTSEALDSATQALVLSHHDICSNRSVSVHTIWAYNNAIHKLRMALDSPVEASSVHSLGAAALLVICRDLNGFSIQDWSIHSLGAAEIVHARRHIQPQDDFERELFQSLQGYLVGHCVFFRAMRLDPDRFEKLVETLADDLEPGNILRYICNIPRLLQRGTKLCDDLHATRLLIQEIHTAYEALTDTRGKLRDLLDTALLPESLSRLQALSEYALTLSLCSIYHCILSGPIFRQSHPVTRGEELVEATLYLAKEVEGLSPLGSAYMFLTLSVAWLCAEDATTMRLIESGIRNLLQNYHRGVQVKHIVLRMEELRYDLQFRREV